MECPWKTFILPLDERASAGAAKMTPHARIDSATLQYFTIFLHDLSAISPVSTGLACISL
jgi:hypothetical protein